MPGTELTTSYVRCHSVIAETSLLRCSLTHAMSFSRSLIIRRWDGTKTFAALCRRLSSCVRVSLSWRFLLSKSLTSLTFLLGKGLISGFITTPNCAIRRASILSVFAIMPCAFANWRTFIGWTITIGKPFSAQASTSLRSYPPVASTKTRVNW